MFADSASPMSSSSPSASSAPSVARRPRSRCRPPGGPTSTSSIARSSPRVGRLSPPCAAVAVDATIVVRGGREGIDVPGYRPGGVAELPGRQTARPRRERPISIPSATGTPIPPSPHRRRSVSDPPPHRCRDPRDGPGAWSEGGGGYFYFVLFVCLAGGIWLLARSHHINFPTTIVTIVDVLNSYVN